MNAEVPAYPWYAIVTGEDLEQGDILEGCPIFFPPDDLATQSLSVARFPPFKKKAES